MNNHIVCNAKVTRYEIYWADLPYMEGSEHVQTGVRPVVIVSNDMGNKYGPVVTVVPLSSRVSKSALPVHVKFITAGLAKESLALCEQIRVIDKSFLGNYIGYISNPEVRDAIDHAMAIQLGIAA